MPPRHMKSIQISVMWPAWEWTFAPHIKWLYSSYAQPLSTRDSVKTRRIIQSSWYQANFGHMFEITSDQNEKMRFENTALGYRLATSVGGTGTGEGGDRIVCDDPHKIGDVRSETKREEVINWWDLEMSSRANDKNKSAFVIVQQRAHEGDLAGHLLDKGGWEHLCLPTEYEEDERRSPTCIGWEDPRKKEGDLLWPNRFNKEAVEEFKSDLGSSGFAGQHQQRPAPAEGEIFKVHWWQFYDVDDPPEAMDEWIQSWDMTFKKAKSSKASKVCCQVWARKGANKYLFYQLLEKLDFPGTIRAFKSVTFQFQQVGAKLIEDKANGPAVLDTLKSEIDGIIEYAPRGSKEERASAISPQIEAGNVFLPARKNPEGNLVPLPWAQDFIDTAAAFPNGNVKDPIDAMSQALDRLKSKTQHRPVGPGSVTKISTWKSADR